jgi:hypothetical protein
MDAFPNDVVLEIFMQCILGGHNKSVKAFAMTSHKWHATTEKIIGELDLKQLCPRLTIWDAKTLGFEVDDEPQIDRFGLIEAYQALASHPVKGNQGILCFPMSKGLSIQGLLSEASKLGLQVVVHPSSPLEGLYSYASPIERTYSLMILESFFEGDFNWQYKEQREFAIKINCNLPSLEESLALHIFKYKVTKQPLLCTHIWGCTETLSKNATGVPLGTEILISFDNQSTYLRITKYVHARMPFNNFTGVCRFLG